MVTVFALLVTFLSVHASPAPNCLNTGRSDVASLLQSPPESAASVTELPMSPDAAASPRWAAVQAAVLGETRDVVPDDSDPAAKIALINRRLGVADERHRVSLQEADDEKENKLDRARHEVEMKLQRAAETRLLEQEAKDKAERQAEHDRVVKEKEEKERDSKQKMDEELSFELDRIRREEAKKIAEAKRAAYAGQDPSAVLLADGEAVSSKKEAETVAEAMLQDEEAKQDARLQANNDGLNLENVDAEAAMAKEAAEKAASAILQPLASMETESDRLAHQPKDDVENKLNAALETATRTAHEKMPPMWDGTSIDSLRLDPAKATLQSTRLQAQSLRQSRARLFADLRTKKTEDNWREQEAAERAASEMLRDVEEEAAFGTRRSAMREQESMGFEAATSAADA